MKKIWNILVLQTVVMLTILHTCESLMCYFCEDSSSKDGRNQCQTWYRTMKYYRKRFEKHGTFTADKYVKNCSAYGDERDPKSCMIAYLEVGGDIKTFMRDCSDGSIFFTEDIDLVFDKSAMRPDNQTHCKQQAGGIACVTLCGADQIGDGHFCNGPQFVSYAGTVTLSLSSFIVSFLASLNAIYL